MSQNEKAVISDALKMEGVSEALKKATGIIPYTFLNDYMFRVILQKHKNVLRSIVCACLKLEVGDVQDIVVQNPIKKVCKAACRKPTYIRRRSVQTNRNQ